MTNPIGSNTRNLTVNIPATLYVALEQLAAASGFKLGAYARAILGDAVERKSIVAIDAASQRERHAAILAGISPLPKIKTRVVAQQPDPSRRAGKPGSAKNTPKKGSQSREN